MITENPHALAVIDRLETVTMASQPLAVGDAVAPRSGDRNVVAPCAVLYTLEGGSLLSSIGCLDTDGTIPFQVTSVGRTASEARTVADKAQAALTASDLTVPGRWAYIRPRSSSSRVDRDDSLAPAPPLFYVVSYFNLLTFQAS